MSGMDLLREIRSHPATNHIPTIMLTISKEKATRLEALQAGVTAYIEKNEKSALSIELLSGLIHLSQSHRQTRALLHSVMKTFGSGVTQDEVALAIQSGECRLVPLKHWDAVVSMSQAIQRLGTNLNDVVKQVKLPAPSGHSAV